MSTFHPITDIFFHIDKDYQITKVHKAASTFLKLPEEKVVGYHCYDLMQHDQ